MTENKYIEQEVKYKIDDVKKLIKKLNELGAVDTGVDFQKTIRFDTKDDKLAKKGIFLRVRSGHGNKITMKKKLAIENSDVHEREEIETTVEDLGKMRQIIVNLGFDKELIMEKYRSNWSYKGADLSIDELFFGTFIEIEATPQLIDEVSNDLGLAKNSRINVTYWDLFAEYKKDNQLVADNIVFPIGYKPIMLV